MKITKLYHINQQLNVLEIEEEPEILAKLINKENYFVSKTAAYIALNKLIKFKNNDN